MPLIEYTYTDEDGCSQVVERLYRRIDEAPDYIFVPEGEVVYAAKRKQISLTSNQSTNWSVGRAGSDLPPEKAPFIPMKGE